MRLVLTGRAVRAAWGVRPAFPLIQAVDCPTRPHCQQKRQRLPVHGLVLYSTAFAPAETNQPSCDTAIPPYQGAQPKQQTTDPLQQEYRKRTNSGATPEPSVHQAFEEQILKLNQPNKIISSGAIKGALISSKPYIFDQSSNLSPNILDLLNRNLYSQPDHPVCITRKLIESVFAAPTFNNLTAPNPVVTNFDNFDALGFPADHPGRSRTDTYYVNEHHVLRTHTSAHQLASFSAMKDPAATKPTGYTICADVYRRDSIDRSHFPVFHQMEGAQLWRLPKSGEDGRPHNHNQAIKLRLTQIEQDLGKLPNFDIAVEDPNPSFHPERNPLQQTHDADSTRLLAAHLKKSLVGLVAKVFTAAREAGLASGESPKEEPLQVRWVEAYFPFVSPGWELEVYWRGEWLELLGCGVVQQKIMDDAGVGDSIGWAWGLGVERLAMVLFGIPDIRLFWSQDERFLKQFRSGVITHYEPFSKYPACYKDVAFWINVAPAAASPLVDAAAGSSGVAAAAGGDATKATPTETIPAAFHENDVMEIVRDVAGSLAEDVKLVDEFAHPRTGRKSLCYRINYRSLERTLTNEEVNTMHNEVVARLASELDIELR